MHSIGEKLGENAAKGSVFEFLQATGEVITGVANDRPVVVTRVLRLVGLEAANLNAYERLIYIHGSPVEGKLGEPDSGGCIRLSSDDVLELFESIPTGAFVYISEHSRDVAIAEFEGLTNRYRKRVSAGQNDDLPAISSLCTGYTYGLFGVPIDGHSAIYWCRKGVEQGDISSARVVAEHNESGRFIAKNYIAAARLYGLASERGDVEASFKAALLHSLGDPSVLDLRRSRAYSELVLLSVTDERQKKMALNLRRVIDEIIVNYRP